MKPSIVLGNTATLGVIVSVALAVLAHIPFVVEPLLDLSSATEAVRPYAREFIQIISLGCVFQVVGMGLNNFIRTTGAPESSSGHDAHRRDRLHDFQCHLRAVVWLGRCG